MCPVLQTSPNVNFTDNGGSAFTSRQPTLDELLKLLATVTATQKQSQDYLQNIFGLFNALSDVKDCVSIYTAMEEPISSEQTTLFASGKRTFEIGRGPRNIIFLTRRATASETILAWMERRLALTSTGPSEMAPRTNQSANRQLSCDQE